ncbi:MAG: endolytic transglycosylase MltG [Acidobacteriota bacterium]|nr:endolytic transglycosylase MltG [Acidobacteriota bacterium]
MPVSVARRIAGIVLLLAVLAVLAVVYAYYRLEHPRRPAVAAGRTTVLFPPKTSTKQIFERLEKEGVLQDARLAEIYYRVYRSGTRLQAGEYQFDRPMPIDEIINRMGKGEVVQYSIVVPEGLTEEETFELFWSRGIGGPEAFKRALTETELLPGLTTGVNDLEGFLFPETYVVTRTTSARQIVDSMVAQFRKNFTPDLREKAHTLGFTPRQAVILASIIEKESAIKSEGPLIAAVYWNRLKKNMRLQADPTVMYAMKRDGRWTGTLHRSDYTYDSPYNTYTNDGLPPGPICNPGLTALKAAVSPAKTDFLYFVADTTGGHTFTRTYEEHLQAIATAHRLRQAGVQSPEPAPTPEPTPARSL